MKKLMITAAAALCATIGFSEITSSNIVGYQQIPVQQGYSMFTPTFQNVAGGTYNLQQIIPQGENVSGDGDIVIQVMDENGQWAGEYVWFTKDGWGMDEDGWYTYAEEIAEVALKSGEAIFVSCDNTDVTFQVSGQVSMGDNNPVNVGYTMSGNSSPVVIDLQDLKPAGDNITGDGDIVIQVMDENGQWAGEYVWFTKDGWGMDEDGWYTYAEEAAEVKLNPGQSVFVSCDNADVTFTVPSAIAK